MANQGSFIRSAARATSSAYKRLPIRWRLAGGSAALTLVILLGFAVIVGVLTDDPPEPARTFATDYGATWATVWTWAMTSWRRFFSSRLARA